KARVIATESQNHLGGYTRSASVLAFSGVPTSTTTFHKRDGSAGEMVIEEGFSYDHQNRLVRHTHRVNGGSVEVLAENIYNELGQLEAKNVGNGIQSIRNEYNIRGALSKMNDPKNLMNKLFGFELKYINPAGTSKRYNGNIAETDWATQSDGTLRRYSYEYDGVNRLKAGNYWDNSGTAAGSYAERLNYDLNGNITGLRRTGLGAGLMDELGYSYDQAGNSNKLIRVSDASGNAAGYPVGGNVIGYDVNGNMVNHLDKGISNIVYNYLNLPSSISAAVGNTNFVYRADGVKLKKVFGAKTTDYLDGFQYENGVLQFVPTSEGYFDVIKNRYIYNYTDHLGNVRLSYTKGASGGAEIIEENNYYPFGLKHEGYNNASLANSAYKYKYQGQELQENGWYSFKWRNYIPELGRFFNIDPLSEKYSYQSHYNFSENAVVAHRELEGLEKVPVNNNSSLIDRAQKGFNTFLNGVSNYIKEISDVPREMQMGKDPSTTKELLLEKRSGIASAKGEIGKGLMETMKGGAYALGESLDKGGEYTSNTALAAAPFTEGTSLSIIPTAEMVSNLGFGIKFVIDITDGNYNNALIEGSKKIISLGIGKLGDAQVNATFKQTPNLTKTEKAIHETVIKGNTTVTSKVIENAIDKKTK
ncbi:RHS repeat-associated core domain-containing protein, partial [Elizabethkingia meningoseptica]